MAHDIPLLATLAVGLALAFLAGLAARRLGLPALVGYLLVGPQERRGLQVNDAFLSRFPLLVSQITRLV